MSYVHSAIVANSICNAWRAYLDYRQVRAMATPFSSLPDEVKQLTTAEIFSKSQAYTADRFKFSMVRTLALGAVDNLLLWSRFSGRLWNFLGIKIQPDTFLHSWAWGSCVDLVETLIRLPWDAYSTFVVEARHGFNKASLGTFLLDRVKTTLLSAFVLRPVMTSVLRWVVARFGAAFPMYLCGASALILVASTFIIPTVVMPLFNKFTALPEGELKSRIERLAQRVGFPLKKIYSMDGSKRSAHSNAFFFGIGSNKRIVLFDTLLEQMTPCEIEAVISHEIGHWQHNHLIQRFAVTLANVFAFGQGAKQILFDINAYTDFGIKGGFTDPSFGFEIFNSVYWVPVQVVLNSASSLLSRRFEFEADAFAVGLGNGPKLQSGLLKMFKENKASITPDWIYAALNYSHPPLVQRLAHLRRFEPQS